MTVVRPVRCTVISHDSVFLVVFLLQVFPSQGIAYAQRQVVRAAQFQTGQPIPFSATGKSAALLASQPRPVAMVSADFDEDGVADLVIGYGVAKGGAIARMRGNLDALAPQSHESWVAAGQGRFASPFLAQADVIAVPEQPDLLRVADINGDGLPDLVFASRNGHRLYVLLGDGKGHFDLQAPVAVGGAITALAAYKPGDDRTSDVVLVGVTTKSGAGVGLFRAAGAGLQQRAAYALPGAANAIEVANLDSDLIPDAAIVANGQLLVLHGKEALKGSAQLETAPLDGVVAATAGEFVFDRHAQLQLSVLTSDGTVHILAHSGFDPLPFTQEEIAAARSESVRRVGAQTLAQKAGNTGNQPWTEVESISGVAPSSFASSQPILLRSRASSSGGEDIVVLNPGQQDIASIRHAASAAHGNTQGAAAAQGTVSHSSLSSGDVAAALSQRISPQGAEGLITLGKFGIRPEITLPASGNVFYVNTTADSLDANNANRCTQTDTVDACSLRDAVTYANQDSAINITDSTVDTIMVPAGTYNLTLNAGVVDGNGNGTTVLDITGPMTIIGVLGSTIIDANGNDKIFSIDPNLNLAFNTTLENLTLQHGVNENNPNVSPFSQDNFGGALDWEAYGTGNLTITSCLIQNNIAKWGPGGGIFASNSLGGSGLLTITNSVFVSNSTPETGGGVEVGYGAAIAISGATFTSNLAQVSVNSSDPGALGQGGGLFIYGRGTSATPQSTIQSGSFSSNAADSDGGGIYTNTGLAITGGTSFEGNTSGGSGGGIFHNSGNGVFAETTTIAGSNFGTNSATTSGGGIEVGEETAANGNLLTVANSRFFGNTSTNGANGLSVGQPGESSGTGAGGVTATENWWGCNAGPATPGDNCDQAVLYDASTGSLNVSPNIVLTLGVSPNPVGEGSALHLDAAVNTDSSSGPVPGGPGALHFLNVAFTAMVGLFSASPSVEIDGTGNATTSVTPTSSGTGSATAKLDNQLVSQSFAVGGVNHFAVSAPATATAGVGFSVTVTAQTAGNATFVGYTGTVHFTSSDGTAILPADATLTNGVGTFSATLKTAAAQTISVNDTVTTAATGTSGSIAVSAGAASSMAINAGSTPQSAVVGTSFANPLAVTVSDQFGNPVSGISVKFTAPASAMSGTFSSSTNTISVSSNAGGVASSGLFTANSIAGGPYTVTALSAGLTAVNFSLTNLPGPATSFAVTAPLTATVGGAFSFTVTANDAFSNVASSYTGTVHFTSSDASAALPADSTLTNGVGTFPATLMTVGSQTMTATDTTTTSVTGTTGSILVTIPVPGGSGTGVNFGSVPVGSTSAPQTLNFTIAPGTVIGKIAVLTKGASGLDYAKAAGSTCTAATYATATNCTVKVALTPAVPGLRIGAVVFYSSTGTVETSIPIYGVGTGPQVVFSPGAQRDAVPGLNAPEGVAIDGAGNLYVAAPNNTVPASLYEYSPNGSGGWTLKATISTSLNNPASLVVNGSGDVFVSNYGGSVDEYSLVGGTWTKVATVVSGADSYGLAADGSGNVYVANSLSGTVLEYSLVNGTWTQSATVATGVNGPFGLAVDSGGNIYVVANGNAKVLEYSLVAGAWQQTATIASGLNYPFQVAVDAAGSVYVTTTSGVLQYSLMGGTWTHVATIGSGFNTPEGVALDGNGDAFITDWGAGSVEEVYRSTTVQQFLDFAATDVGMTSTDSPKTQTAENIGNAVLNLTGLSYPTDFPENPGGGTNACTSTTNLNPAGLCNLNVDFTPLSGGFGGYGTQPHDEYVTLTDNALNAAGAQQSILVFGGSPGIKVSEKNISAVVGVEFNGQVATFTDGANQLPPSSYFASINFGDGDGDGIISQPGGTGTPYVVNGSHLYVQEGEYTTDTNVGTVGIGPNEERGQGLATVVVGPPTQFAVSAPTTVAEGSSFSFSVTALDQFGNVSNFYSGTVHFTSTDPFAALPADYTFTAGDAGVKTFLATLFTIGSQTITSTDTTTAAITGTSGSILVSVPSFVVLNTNDAGTGSLRAALATAAAAGSGNITFDPTVFATAKTITLTSGTLNIPSHTTIQGNTTGSGASLTNLVTVSGANTYVVFTVAAGVTGASISALTIRNGSGPLGGGIDNNGALTVTGSVFSANSASVEGGAIYNGTGTLAVNDCTFSGNLAPDAAGLISWGTATVSDSTFTVNAASAEGGAISVAAGSTVVNNSSFSGNSAPTAGAIYNQATLTVSESTFSANTASGVGGGIVNNLGGTLTANNNIFSGNTAASGGGIDNLEVANASNNVFYNNTGGSCIGCNTNANAVDADPKLAALANYGGPTQTMMPLPGSVAICAGLAADIPTGVTTDQRGNPRTTTIYSGSACVDAGAVQTAYSLNFTASPSSVQQAGVPLSPVPMVQLSDNGHAISVSGAQISVAPAAGTLNGTATVPTNAAGVATFSGVSVSTEENNDTLIASAPFYESGTSSISNTVITATSGSFSVVAITLAPGTLPGATVGAAYSQPITASNGSAPYTYTVIAGALPAGLSLNSSTGVLAGTPTAGGSFPFTVQAKDNLSFTGTKAYTLGVAAPTITLSPLTLPGGTYHTAYSQTITASGGTATYAYAVTAGTLPGGLFLNGATGAITGAPSAAGPFSFTITATDSSTGTGPFSASQAYSVSISQATQTINFTAPASPVTFAVAPITLTATGGASGNPVVFSVVSGPGSIAGNTLTITGAGTVVVAANQAGNANYAAAAQVSHTVVVNQATQTINFTAPASPVTFGVAPITLSATGGASGNPVVFSVVSGPGSIIGSVLTITGAGTVVVAAKQAGNANYTAAAQVSHTVVVNQATQTINFVAPASPVAFGVAPITLSATGGASGNPVVFSVVSGPGSITGNTLTITGAGTVVVAANQAGNANYTAAAQVTQTIVVNAAPQTIKLSSGTLADASGVTFGVTPLTLSATSTSGLTVTFSLISGPATLNGNTLTISGAGTAVVAANQAGNSNYGPAPQVTESIPVNKALPIATIISSVNPILVQNGITFTATVSSGAGTPTGTVTFLDGSTPLGTGTLSGGVATFATSSLSAGTHTITAAYGGDANFLTANSSSLTQNVEDFGFTISSQTVTVLPGGAAVFTFTVSPIDGSTFPAAITFTANGLPTGATYTFSPATLTAGEGPTTVTLTIDVPRTQAGINPAGLRPNIQAAANRVDGKAGTRGGTLGGVASHMAPFALAFILLPFAGRLRRAGKRLGRTLSILLLLAAGMAAVAGISGCGSTSGFFAQQQQSYTVTVTGTSGALSHSATVTLTVE